MNKKRVRGTIYITDELGTRQVEDTGTAPSSLPTVKREPPSNLGTESRAREASPADARAFYDFAYKEAERDLKIEQLEKDMVKVKKDLEDVKSLIGAWRFVKKIIVFWK